MLSTTEFLYSPSRLSSIDYVILLGDMENLNQHLEIKSLWMLSTVLMLRIINLVSSVYMSFLW